MVGAQTNQPPIIGTTGNANPIILKSVANKTVNCIDSVRYPQSKLTGIAETGPLTNNTAAQTGISQAYHLNTAATINGIGAYLLLDFDGVPGNVAPVVAKIKVYDIDGQNYPTTQIDSAMIQVADVGFNEQVLMFSSPVAVTDSFAITIEMGTFNATTDTIYYTTNVCGWDGSVCLVGDGNNEDLSCVLSPDFVSANGSSWFNNNIEVFGWNIDMLMHPIIEQNFTSTYTTDVDSICPNGSVVFTNNSVLNTVSMFNQYGAGMPLYEWDFDDGSGIYNPFDTTYGYVAPGGYNTQLKLNYYGYSTNCVDSSNHLITVHDTAIANFGFVAGGVSFAFYDSSSYANTYSWDFGDGSPLDITQNPVHTFPLGSYQVCLTVTDSAGCSSDMFCDSVTFAVGIDDFYAADYVKVYPIPANKYFNVTVPNNYFNGNVIITDVVGQQLKLVAIDHQEKIKVSTDGIASGVYFVSIEYNGERVFTKRIVIDR